MIFKAIQEIIVKVNRFALSVQPNHPWLNYWLIETLIKQKQWEEAAFCCRQAIEMCPDFPWFHYNLAKILFCQHFWDEAIAACQKAIQLEPNFSWFYHTLGESYEAKDFLDQAIAAHQRSTELKPKSPIFVQALQQVLDKKELWQENVIKSRQAIDLNPELIPEKTTYYNETLNDRWIFEYIFPGKRGGYFLEAGAANGMAASSCYVLEKELGWTGICVEPNDHFFEQLVHNRPNSICEQVCLSDQPGIVTFIQGKPGLVGPYLSGIKSNLENYKLGSSTVIAEGKEVEKEAVTLEYLLKKHNAPQVIDYGAFDIEGSELKILEAFPFDQYQFLALSIECDESVWEILYPLLVSKGYRQVKNPFNRDKIWEKYCLHESLKP